MVLAGERERLTRKHTLHDLHRFGEPCQANRRSRHGHADHVVFGLVPSRAHPDVEAAATHPIERGERLGEHGGGPESFAEHQRAEANLRDATRQRRERDHRIETRFFIRRAAVLPDVEEEMIREPHRIESGCARALRVVDDGVELQRALALNRIVVLRECEPETHRSRVPKDSRDLAEGVLRWLACSNASRTSPKAAT
jgi:hypothetical protein